MLHDYQRNKPIDIKLQTKHLLICLYLNYQCNLAMVWKSHPPALGSRCPWFDIFGKWRCAAVVSQILDSGDLFSFYCPYSRDCPYTVLGFLPNIAFGTYVLKVPFSSIYCLEYQVEDYLFHSDAWKFSIMSFYIQALPLFFLARTASFLNTCFLLN